MVLSEQDQEKVKLPGWGVLINKRGVRHGSLCSCKRGSGHDHILLQGSIPPLACDAFEMTTAHCKLGWWRAGAACHMTCPITEPAFASAMTTRPSVSCSGFSSRWLLFSLLLNCTIQHPWLCLENCVVGCSVAAVAEGSAFFLELAGSRWYGQPTSEAVFERSLLSMSRVV